MPERPTLSQKYDELSASLKVAMDTISRIDERVGIFVQKLEALERKIDHHVENCPVKCNFPELTSRVSVLEARNGKEIKERVLELRDHTEKEIEGLNNEIKEADERIRLLEVKCKEVQALASSSQNRWKIIGWAALNIIVPIVWVLIASWLLYYMGIASPPTP